MRKYPGVFGKLLGAIVGLMLGLLVQGWAAGFVFAAIGAFIGHRYDELHQAPEELDEDVSAQPLPTPAAPPLGALPPPVTTEEINATARAHFARHVCALFADVARADGEVVRDEVRVVREFFEQDLGFSARELELVRTSLKDALANPVDLDTALDECVEQLQPSERLLVLNALYELALADGELRRSERERIRLIAEGLEIPRGDVRAIAALHFGDDSQHYERLGLTPEATDDEVKTAFRRLASVHHPDRVAQLGAGAQELAARTFREIKDAYEEIRRARGM